MRDDHTGVPNGRPIPFPGGSSKRNGVARPDCAGALRTRVLPAEADGPIDLVAVQADDALVNALGTAGGSATGASEARGLGPGGHETDDRLLAMLAAWRAEIDAEPIPELLDLDSAVAAVTAGVKAEAAAARRRRSSRLRHLAPLAAAAAIIVATVSGVGLGSQNAQPGDALWPVQKVLNSERADSVEAKVTIETRLASVRTALAQGDTATAARELDAIRSEIPEVRRQDGRNQLVQEQEFLAAKLADTQPGTPADLSTAPTSKPNARPTGAAPAPASPATPPASPSQTGRAGSTGPTAPSSSDGQDRDELDRSGAPVVPPGTDTGGPTGVDPSGSNPSGPDPSGSDPSGSDPSGAGSSGAASGADPSTVDPRSSGPEVTRAPDATPSDPARDTGTGTGTGSVDPTTAPGPRTVPGGGTPAGSATPPPGTTTASGSVGTSMGVTATATTNSPF
jgi:hypothetical protein